MKTQFGELGIYLIEKAKKEIKEKNQQMLFLKAEIKKKNSDNFENKSQKLKKNYLNQFNKELNTNLSSTLLNSKERILRFKNKLINECIIDLQNELKKRIEKNYSGYSQYLLDSISQVYRNNKNMLKNSILYFNERDYAYLNKNSEIIEKITKKKGKKEISNQITLGGFILQENDGEITFNYNLSSIIYENRDLIEIQFSELIPDSEIKDLQKEFELFVNKKKEEIKNHLIKYDKI